MPPIRSRRTRTQSLTLGRHHTTTTRRCPHWACTRSCTRLSPTALAARARQAVALIHTPACRHHAGRFPTPPRSPARLPSRGRAHRPLPQLGSRLAAPLSPTREPISSVPGSLIFDRAVPPLHAPFAPATTHRDHLVPSSLVAQGIPARPRRVPRPHPRVPSVTVRGRCVLSSVFRD